jgi:hypothetical protein
MERLITSAACSINTNSPQSSFPYENIHAIQSLGYTEDEARFLYIVANHSGYFVPRQFIAFTGASWGKRLQLFTDKLESRGHVTWREYQGMGGVYHLFSKTLYRQIDRENLRNRRRHSTEFIRTRLLLLDFVLANQVYDYLETEDDKVRFCCDELAVPKKALPAKAYEGASTPEPTLRYFVDKFPLFLAATIGSSSPVVTFSYVDHGQASIAGFANHLNAYASLFFRHLRSFRFVYIAPFAVHFTRAEQCFSSLVKTPLQAGVSGELERYFRLRAAWDGKQYGTLSSDDIEWLDQANTRFRGSRIERLKYGFGMNFEQPFNNWIGLFGRWGWNEGKHESFAYTEVDQTWQLGVGANGVRWHRKFDRAGLVFVSNGISRNHQKYLAYGGYGFILGDGKLNYGRENILESYYTLHLWRGIFPAVGLQYVVDPGYNRDRGPVIVPTLRLNLEF